MAIASRMPPALDGDCVNIIIIWRAELQNGSTFSLMASGLALSFSRDFGTLIQLYNSGGGGIAQHHSKIKYSAADTLKVSFDRSYGQCAVSTDSINFCGFLGL